MLILFVPKREEANEDWKQLQNWKFNFSFPLSVKVNEAG
jgi:hypothetical protein